MSFVMLPNSFELPEPTWALVVAVFFSSPETLSGVNTFSTRELFFFHRQMNVFYNCGCIIVPFSVL